MIKNHKYDNFFYRIFYSFYSRDFYRYVATEQKRSGFIYLAVLLLFTYLVPSIYASEKLQNFSFRESNLPHIKNLTKEIDNFPTLATKEGR